MGIPYHISLIWNFTIVTYLVACSMCECSIVSNHRWNRKWMYDFFMLINMLLSYSSDRLVIYQLRINKAVFTLLNQLIWWSSMSNEWLLIYLAVHLSPITTMIIEWHVLMIIMIQICSHNLKFVIRLVLAFD